MDEDYNFPSVNYGLASSMAKPATGLNISSTSFAPKVGVNTNVVEDTPWYGSITKFLGNGKIEEGKGLLGAVSNPYLMQGITGLGSLGLGLANYFQQKPLLEAQKNALNQNIAFAKEDQARQRKNYESAARWTPPTQGRL